MSPTHLPPAGDVDLARGGAASAGSDATHTGRPGGVRDVAESMPLDAGSDAADAAIEAGAQATLADVVGASDSDVDGSALD